MKVPSSLPAVELLGGALRGMPRHDRYEFLPRDPVYKSRNVLPARQRGAKGESNKIWHAGWGWGSWKREKK